MKKTRINNFMKGKSSLKKISKSKIFIFTGIFFLLFVFIWNIFNWSLIVLWLFLILFVILLNFFIYIKKYLIYLIFILFWALLGLFFSYFSNISIIEKQKFLNPYYNIKYKISWEITWINKIKDFESEYIIKLKNIKELNNDISVLDSYLITSKNIEWLITIPSNFNIQKWDIIEFSEKLIKIKNFNNNFNYEKFSYSKNLYFKINAWSVNNIWKIEQNFIVDKIDNTRQILLKKINKLYPQEEAIFLWWILLWARESMPEDLKTNFNNSWLTHFIAVSGFNITILIVFLSYILKIFPIFIRVVFITLSIIVFVILVWDSVSVIRASIMWLVWYYILVSWRTTDNLAVLVFVWFIMVLISPLSINYDVSLHLSFLAVLWILYTQKIFEKIFYFLPDFLAIREAFVLTLSAMSFALPIILFNFWQLSILSPFANIAVTWTIPLAMLWWFLSICVDFVYNWLAIWISYFTWILLAWDIKIVHFFGGLDWAIIKADLGIYKYSLEVLYFVILIFLINYFKKD